MLGRKRVIVIISIENARVQRGHFPASNQSIVINKTSVVEWGLQMNLVDLETGRLLVISSQEYFQQSG